MSKKEVLERQFDDTLAQPITFIPRLARGYRGSADEEVSSFPSHGIRLRTAPPRGSAAASPAPSPLALGTGQAPEINQTLSLGFTGNSGS